MNARFVKVKAAEDPPTAGRPAFGKILVNTKPTAYVCQGQTYSLPTTEPALVAALLGD